MFLTVAVLILLQVPIYRAGQAGIAELQKTASAEAMRAVVEGWTKHGVLNWALAAMLFDYVFMLAYGVALYLGARAALFGLTDGTGPLAAAFRAAAILAIAAAVLDALENALELWIASRRGPDALADRLAPVAFAVTIAKWLCAAVAFAAWLAGVGALITGRLEAQP
jgi:hypothetical protein